MVVRAPLRGHTVVLTEFVLPSEYQEILVKKASEVSDRMCRARPSISETLRSQYTHYIERCKDFGAASVSFEFWSSLYLLLEYELSKIEREVLYCIMLGYHNKAIGERLFYTPPAVKGVVKRINKKLSLSGEDSCVSEKIPVRVFLGQLASLCWTERTATFN